MASDTEIANKALIHLGQSKFIDNLDTEDSNAANIMRRLYDEIQERLIRDFPNDFARTEKTLGLISEDPTTDWKYSYEYPSDCARAIRIKSGVKQDNAQTRVVYEIRKGASGGRVIYTNLDEAVLEYVCTTTTEGDYKADFTLVFSLLLAFYAAPAITDGDENGLGNRALEAYFFELSNSRANAANENQTYQDPDSEYIRAREGDTVKGSGEDWSAYPNGYSIS